MSRFEAEQTNSLAPLAAAEGQGGRPNRAVVPCRPTLDAVAHSSCQLSTRFRLNPCIFGLNTLPKSFLGTDTPKTRALATPEQVATAPVPSRGGQGQVSPSYHAQLPRAAPQWLADVRAAANPRWMRTPTVPPWAMPLRRAFTVRTRGASPITLAKCFF